MDALKQFSIPIMGISTGIHQFEFQIDHDFFKAFEDSPISEGDAKLVLDFDKRPNMFVLTFDIVGSVKATCDRCLDTIDVIIDDTQNLMVKFANEPSVDPDIAHIPIGQTELNVAKFAYEYIILAMPITLYCEDTEKATCNEDMLKYLKKDSTDDDTQDSNPIWDEIKKNIKKN